MVVTVIQHYECVSYHYTVRLKMVRMVTFVMRTLISMCQYIKRFPNQLEKTWKESLPHNNNKDKITYRNRG